MLTTPTTLGCPIAADSNKLDQTLSQPNDARYTDDQRHQVLASTGSIRFGGGGGIAREEHTCRHKEIAKHFCIAREHISEQDVAELAILHLSQASYADSSKCVNEA